MVRFAALSLLLCMPVVAQVPPPVTVPDSVALEANIAYDKFPDTRLDILYPKSSVPGLRPVVVLFHGGGWILGNKETMMTACCLPFLEQGFVVANVEYRLAPAALAPAAVDDALTAAKWFYDHAAQYHVDTKRLVVTGASAGGHLALMVGMTSPVPFAAIVNGTVSPTSRTCSTVRTTRASAAMAARTARPAGTLPSAFPLTYVRKGLPPTPPCRARTITPCPTNRACT